MLVHLQYNDTLNQTIENPDIFAILNKILNNFLRIQPPLKKIFILVFISNWLLSSSDKVQSMRTKHTVEKQSGISICSFDEQKTVMIYW